MKGSGVCRAFAAEEGRVRHRFLGRRNVRRVLAYLRTCTCSEYRRCQPRIQSFYVLLAGYIRFTSTTRLVTLST